MEIIEKPVLIVGSGLSGLAAAMEFERSGVPYVLFEKNNYIGGRVHSEMDKDGVVSDVGFQVLLTSYPELHRYLDLKLLDLQYFESGAVLVRKSARGVEKNRLANPLFNPWLLGSALFFDRFSFSDKLAFLKVIVKAMRFHRPNSEPVIDFLKKLGFSKAAINSFWKPFFGGVFLDNNLGRPTDFLLFLLRYFAVGRVAVPKGGMQKIPQQMASRLNQKSVKTNFDVIDYDQQTVRNSTGEVFLGSRVLIAYNKKNQNSEFFNVQNYYFTGTKPPRHGRWLHLCEADSGFISNNIMAMSEISDSYTKNRTSRFSVSVIGHELVSESALQQELSEIFPESVPFEFDRLYKVVHALPRNYVNKGFSFENGIYYCGDQFASPSINGALESGRKVATEIIKSIRSGVKK